MPPLNFASMLLQPSAVSPWNFQGGGEASTAREQLALARQRFEWEKKQAEEDARLAREKQAAETARAKLQVEAEKAAKLQEDRLKAYGEFTKAAGEGNVEATRAMVPMLDALGMGVELEGEEGGLPRYRIDMDRAAAERAEAGRLAQASPYGENETAQQSLGRLGAMGLGGETGALLPPLGIRASDEVDPATGRSVADRVAATYGTPGEKTATRGPDTEDFTGGMPRNVLDMGASAAATLHRLDPALKGAVAAYPDEVTQKGAEAVRTGLRSSGLPYEKQAALFDKTVSSAATQRNAQIAAQAQTERFREQRDELTETQEFAFEKAGRDDADKFATDNKIHDLGKALRAGDTILDVIDDKVDDNDGMIASELMTFQNVKGTPSDTDLKLAFDIPFSTAMDQALNMIGKLIKGGMQPVQKEAIKAYIKAKRGELERGAFEYLDQANARAAGGAYNERARKAYLQTVKGSVPGHVYNSWLDMKKARDEGAAGDSGKSAGAQYDPAPLSEMSDIELELEGQALEAGLDPEQIRPLMRTESGGDPTVKNKMGSSASGLFQFTDETAQKAGLKNAAEYAALPPDKQIALALDRFKKLGLNEDSTRDDYALANAAPAYVGKPDSTVIEQYKAGTPFGDDVRAKNPGWIPPGGGDITVGSIKRFYRGGKGGGAKASALPEPKTPAEKRYLELLKKRGN